MGEKSKVEQMVNAVEEGFKTQMRILTNTIWGNNQTKQVNQARDRQANQIEEMYAQELQRIQPPLPMQWARNFPQLTLPTNMHPTNQMTQPNMGNTRPNPPPKNNRGQKV